MTSIRRTTRDNNKDTDIVKAKAKNKQPIANIKMIPKSKTQKIIVTDLDDSDCESIDIENLSQHPTKGSLWPMMNVNTNDSETDETETESKLESSQKQSIKTIKKVAQKNSAETKNNAETKTTTTSSVAPSIKITKNNSISIKKDILDIDDKKNTKMTIKTKRVNYQNAKNKRVVMYLDDDPAKPVTAGGVMIYKYVQSKMMLLIIEVDGKYEDIGGKIDPEDDDIFCAVARETQEETNNQIMSEDIIDRLKTSPYVYVPKSKYVIYMVEAIDDERKLKKADFGDMEEHDGFPRTIGWIARDVLMKPHNIKYKMNWRLKSKQLFDQLIEIEKNVKYKKKIFKSKSKKDDTSEDNDIEETYTPGEDE